MRILVALDNWGLIGGSERYAGEVVAALAARGHRVNVLAGAQRTPAFALPAGCELAVLPAYSAPRATPRELAELARAARAAAPDVALVLACFQARTFQALLGVAPVVRFVQDHTLFCPSLNKLYSDGTSCTEPLGLACLERYFLGEGCSCFRRQGRARPWIEGLGELKKKYFEFESAKRARRLVVASRYMQRELVRAGAADGNVRVIPYFTRSGSATIPRAELPAGVQRFLASGSGTLCFTPARLVLPDKGLDVLLEALARTARPVRAVIAGDGPARPWLEAQARALGLAARVHFPGWLAAGEVEALHARAEVCVFPSTWNEPFGLVGIEAMAHGKPVVGFDVGGVSEWLEHGVTGLLAPCAGAPALAEAIDALAADPALAARLGAAGRERVRREFGVDLHLERLEAALRP